MLWKVIRELIREQVQEVAKEAAAALLDPCARLLGWQIVRRRSKRPVVQRFADWRIRKLHARCRRIGDGHCDVDALLRQLGDLDALERKIEERAG